MTAADPESAAPTPDCPPDRRALVTGANSAMAWRGECRGPGGADVVVTHVAGEDRAQEVVRAIEQHGAEASAHLADASDETQVLDMFRTMAQRLGTIDIVVNKAGLQHYA